MASKRKRAPAQQPTAAEIAARLDALYAELPALPCEGKCWHSCGPVLMAPAERERILQTGGVKIPTYPPERHGQLMTCPAMKSHRCTVHEVRPMMCRLWGIAEWMRCPFGCKPEGGWMSEREAHWFFLRTYEIAGWPVEQRDESLTPKQITERLRRLEAEYKVSPPPRVDPGPARGASRARSGFLRRRKGAA